MSIVFIYLLLNLKILFQTIQLTISTVSMSKIVPFQTIQFSKVCSLNVETFLFQTIQFNTSTQFKYQSSSISSNAV